MKQFYAYIKVEDKKHIQSMKDHIIIKATQ